MPSPVGALRRVLLRVRLCMAGFRVSFRLPVEEIENKLAFDRECEFWSNRSVAEDKGLGRNIWD